MFRRYLESSTLTQLDEEQQGRTQAAKSRIIAAPPVVLDSDMPIEAALKALSKAQTHFAPVYDNAKGQYLGFVDALDLVSFQLRILHAASGQEPLGAKGFDLSHEPISKLIDASQCDPWVETTVNAPLNEILDIFADGVHRIAIVSPFQAQKARLIAVVNQCDLMQLLTIHLPELGSNAARSVRDLNVGSSDVSCVDINAPVIEAFDRLSVFRIAGIAVVNHKHQLVDSLCADDLQGTDSSDLGNGSCTVEMFLDAARKKTPRAPLLCVSPDTPFSEVVGSLAQHDAGRVFVVDSAHKPLAVIARTDVIRVYLDLAQGRPRAGA